MALSDYLTGPEWDACFYASMGQHQADSFGDSMHKTINVLLKSGYRFSGLDETGEKKVQVENGVNAPKVCMFLGNPHKCDPFEIMNTGRKFLKEHLPLLVDQTDEEWNGILTEARTTQEA